MTKTKIGLAGIGKLGSALMSQWAKHDITIGVYHPNQAKAESFISYYPNGFLLKETDITQLDVMLLALPAKRIIPFIQERKDTDTLFINMATSLSTEEVRREFPDKKIAGLKFMGHAADLSEHGNGLFITEQQLPAALLNVFRYVGEVKNDDEDVVIKVNKMATYQAIKAAVEIEKEFERKHLPMEYKERALTSLAPEVIRSYSQGKLGHFGQEIAKEFKGKL
ncbi:NADP oxidoreductase coenzyme F420-dependent [Thalassobacillus cyri]|uniref:NADP oxidoreductase coenzyme F420-dependent n=1 Tax=Thalassobacillus cyri TaxID=571932 RepID=A0A1H3XNA0_9BACI|nr:NAD(P)-binding domain-containing protein [Thalassobacillus cyri]SEA00826.1 NADP oxidoreductase coenzyme F420-dependent [Thalassobacillus cyri]